MSGGSSSQQMPYTVVFLLLQVVKHKASAPKHHMEQGGLFGGLFLPIFPPVIASSSRKPGLAK
jgi:hypothetical protein